MTTSLDGTYPRGITPVLRALNTLRQAHKVLLRADSEAALMEQMCETITQAGDYPLSWYGVPVLDEARSVRVVSSFGPSKGYLNTLEVSWGDGPLGQGPAGMALRKGKSQQSDDLASDASFSPWIANAALHGLKSALAMPVMVNGLVEGVLVVYSNAPDVFDASARSVLEDLVADLGFGLAKLRDERELKDLSQNHEKALIRLRSTLDAQLDPFMVVEAVIGPSGEPVDMVVAEVNDAACNMMQRDRRLILGGSLLGMFPSVVGRELVDQLMLSYVGQLPVVIDGYELVTPTTGRRMTLDVRGVVHKNGMAVTWRDVTDRVEAARVLAASEERFRLLAENSSDVVAVTDMDLVFEWASPSMTSTFGWSLEDLVGHSVVEFIHPEDIPGLMSAVRVSADTRTPSRQRYRWRCQDGSYRWVEGRGSSIINEEGHAVGRVAGMRDVHDQVLAEQALASSASRYRLLAENTSDMVWQVSEDGLFEWVSSATPEFLGVADEDLIGKAGMEWIHPDDRQAARAIRDRAASGQPSTGDFRVLLADGGSRWFRISVHRVDDGTHSRVLSLRDIEPELNARRELEHALGHDPLTGLPSRHAVEDLIAQALTEGCDDCLAGIFYMDIDGMSSVNDALSHHGGDLLILALAAHLAGALPEGASLARGFGDELIAVVPKLPSAKAAADAASALLEAAHTPVIVSKTLLNPSVTVGVALGARGDDVVSLLREASVATSQGKALGGDQYIFADSQMALEAASRLDLEAAIRTALDEGQFTVYFQPIVDLVSKKTVGFEALARWSISGQVRTPDEFLPLMEATRMVYRLDEQVLRESLRVLSSWGDAGRELFVSVNVSAATLQRTDYPALVRQELAVSGVDPSRLHLEITETVLLTVSASSLEVFQSIASMGVNWYVDDFGTGFSSLSHLRDLPIAGVKLDKSFTDVLSTNQGDRLAGGVAGLAHGLVLDMVAEGVETWQQVDILRAHGWTRGQGYLFGHPEPTEGLTLGD